MLGTPHMPEFFDGIKNPKIRDPLKRITNETLEELEGFEKILKDFGCKVIRTKTEHEHIDYYDGFIPRNAMQPRDAQLAIDDKLVITVDDNKGILNAVRENVDKSSIMFSPSYADFLRERMTQFTEWEDEDTTLQLYACCITAINDDVFIDTLGLGKNADPDVDWFKRKFPHKNIKPISWGGHSDGGFAAIKQNVALTLYEGPLYKESLPGWDMCYLPEQGSHHRYRLEWNDWSHKVKGRWYVKGEGDNDEFIHFVNSWLDTWVGNINETVFDVNVLALDDRHVAVAQNDNPTVNEFLKKHNIEPVYVPWTHRWFWDAGLHCVTLDLEREY
jgi:hypothetical protein